jgi:hypothetical protein
MFDGFCAENPAKESICKNKTFLHFKSINKIPPFSHPKPPGVAGATAAKRKLMATSAPPGRL